MAVLGSEGPGLRSWAPGQGVLCGSFPGARGSQSFLVLALRNSCPCHFIDFTTVGFSSLYINVPYTEMSHTTFPPSLRLPPRRGVAWLPAFPPETPPTPGSLFVACFLWAERGARASGGRSANLGRSKAAGSPGPGTLPSSWGLESPIVERRAVPAPQGSLAQLQ